ncbi:hypothetical protein AVDCRST_MAG82-1094 [uncultured Rubrobacteraceae bacterium]|uniref:Uncharacterized protein n=1 Tax=uncultured Rubrobacteraceae bacterium TaxID=349277 RepID=A0A6J4PGX6_9ACTN|nr:hypothetical protein AVDCRST_MAG82-1094 [uncultured Rubrobacteraceae bacterium]
MSSSIANVSRTSPRARKRQQPHVLAKQKVRQGCHLPIATDQGGRRCGRHTARRLDRRASGREASGRRLELGEGSSSEPQSFPQHLHGIGVRTASLSALEEADGLGGEAWREEVTTWKDVARAEVETIRMEGKHRHRSTRKEDRCRRR